MEALELTEILNLREESPLPELFTEEQVAHAALRALTAEKARQDQVYNLTANLRPNRRPYFAR